MKETKKEIINNLKIDLEQIKKQQEVKNYLLSTFDKYFPNILFQNINYLVNILIQLMNENKCEIKDLQPIGDMSNNFVLRVGNDVLKIGIYREVEPNDIPKHKNILASKKLIFYKGIYIEEQEYIDNKWYEDLTEDEIFEEEYKLFKILKDDGIDWTDIKKENIGKDKNGNLIVIDRDHLFVNSEDIIRMPYKYFDFLTNYSEGKKPIRIKKH